jgi:predicted DNA binding protein
MSVIAELHVDAEQFALGRILPPVRGTRLELERVVPTGETTVPLVWVETADPDRFAEAVRSQPTVDSFDELDRFDTEALYALHWDTRSDDFLAAISQEEGHLLDATGAAGTWTFELRFRSHESLSAFQRHCEATPVLYDVRRVTTTTEPAGRHWHGLTESQREALHLAVESGYYDIPRRRSTMDLAEELGISDQAVTERLRRAIVALSRSTLLEEDTR